MDVLQQVKQEGLLRCRGCNQVIYDRHISRTSPNDFFHSNCLRCSKCSKVLDSKYFETSGQMFCQEDYLTHYGPSCSGCARKITNEQYFFSIKHSPNQANSMHGIPPGQPQQLFFHDNCFSCTCCGRAMQRGEKYYVMDNPQQKTPVICHDVCAMKLNNIDNNQTGALANPTPPNPAPRARRGRMKQPARMA